MHLSLPPALPVSGLLGVSEREGCVWEGVWEGVWGGGVCVLEGEHSP